MVVLSEKQLKRLADHKYSRAGEPSLMEPWFAAFWDWTVAQTPMWLAPNCITLAGLILNVLTSVIILCYNYDGKHMVPPWAYIFAAVGLFAYQVLDSIDGKQARRTGSSSPLGELFDHGCDAISTVFVALSFCLTTQFTREPYMLFFLTFFMMFLFYLAHWQTYVTGSLRFGKLDVTEAQWTVITAFLLTASFGEQVWDQEVAVLGVSPQRIIIALLLLGGALQIFSNFRIIFTRGTGRNGSTVAGTSVLFPLFPIATLIIFALIIAKKSNGIYEENPCLYILTFGMMFSKVTMRVIVSHMTKSELDYFDSVYFGFGILFMNQYFDVLFEEHHLLWVSLVYCILNVLYYSHAVSKQICDYLNIFCFSITTKPRNGSSSQLSGGVSCTKGDSGSGGVATNGRSKKSN